MYRVWYRLGGRSGFGSSRHRRKRHRGFLVPSHLAILLIFNSLFLGAQPEPNSDVNRALGEPYPGPLQLRAIRITLSCV